MLSRFRMFYTVSPGRLLVSSTAARIPALMSSRVHLVLYSRVWWLLAFMIISALTLVLLSITLTPGVIVTLICGMYRPVTWPSWFSILTRFTPGCILVVATLVVLGSARCTATTAVSVVAVFTSTGIELIFYAGLWFLLDGLWLGCCNGITWFWNCFGTCTWVYGCKDAKDKRDMFLYFVL